METLALFARQPRLGKTKTRLAKAIGDAAAARLYSAFLCDLAESCAHWAQQKVGTDPNRRLVIYADPDVEDPVLAEIARRAGARTCSQVKGDLGVKMQACLKDEFSRGARSVCIIGSDSPQLQSHDLDHAFRALRWHPVVLGPSFDGGYWLVGSQRPAPDLFSKMTWSTNDVLRAAIERCEKETGEKPHLLPMAFDVDTAEDLQRLVSYLYGTDKAKHTLQALLEMKLTDEQGHCLFELPQKGKQGAKGKSKGSKNQKTRA